MSIPPTIGVDFDGTICELAYPGIGPPKRGAREALIRFRELGFRIVIWTCRTCGFYYEEFGTDPNLPTMERPVVKEMVEWLNRHDIPYDEIDDGSRGKLHADIYLDDKGIRVGDNWEQIMDGIVAAQCGGEKSK